ncbi:MAG: VCBS repeat-containing protein [Planctomycetota bacterium]|nr:VCBS repeat-containing protein [Planctomycetota bacterium]
MFPSAARALSVGFALALALVVGGESALWADSGEAPASHVARPPAPATQPVTAPTTQPDPATVLPGAGIFEKHVVDDYFPAISVAAVDVDGDGRPDIVAAGGPSGQRADDSNKVYWYRAPLWRRLPVATLNRRSVVMQVEGVDLSHSAKQREAIAKTAGSRPAGPWSPGTSPAAPGGQILIVDGGLGKIWWYRASHDAKAWNASIILNDLESVRGVAVGDIDGDGWDDLFLPTQLGAPKHGLAWARNPTPAPGNSANADAGKNEFWQRFPLAEKFDIPGWQHGARLAKLHLPSASGAPDSHGSLAALVAWAGDPGWAGYWLPPAGKDPRGAWTAHKFEGPMKQVTHLEPIDLDGDGHMSVVAAEGHGKCLWLLRAPGFAPELIDDEMYEAHCLAIADFDGDGRPDIAACSNAMATVAIYFNQGGGKFRKVVIDDAQCGYDLRAADLNGDGRLDLLVAGQNSWNVVWYENLMAAGKTWMSPATKPAAGSTDIGSK